MEKYLLVEFFQSAKNDRKLGKHRSLLFYSSSVFTLGGRCETIDAGNDRGGIRRI